MTEEGKAWEQMLGEIHDKKFPTDPILSGDVKKAVFEKLQLSFWNILENYSAIGENADLNVRYSEYIAKQIVFNVRSWILDGHKVDRVVPTTIEFPATVWDHWKLKHGPHWLVKRWPVKFEKTIVPKEIHKHYLCPHINAKDDRMKHVEWMYRMSGQDQ